MIERRESGGQYGDGRTYELPTGWEAAKPVVLSTALTAATAALESPAAADRLGVYYDPDGNYAGRLFVEVEPNLPYEVGASDLWAVATLSIPVNARHGRLLLDPGDSRTQVMRQLNAIREDTALTDLGHAPQGSAECLSKMWDLHDTLRSLLATEERSSVHWVFASKLCARKRPRLFPVRDTLVCELLGGGRSLKTGDGWPGDFSIDIQVFAYLITHPRIAHAIEQLRRDCRDRSVRVDDESLRLLDAALWTYAKWGGAMKSAGTVS